ncbi:hypothetical protein NIES4073_35030 [Kalymmatonema gypsitolerans NIES-4073]|nr:hypothetical protein SAMD00079811_59690 [Scytonema sp. HK-05]BAZ22616.1 hypothetical protein NIES4073_35030 [Scytonema sp. NIES-4073]
MGNASILLALPTRQNEFDTPVVGLLDNVTYLHRPPLIHSTVHIFTLPLAYLNGYERAK